MVKKLDIAEKGDIFRSNFPLAERSDRVHVDVSRLYRKDRDRADNVADLARGRSVSALGDS